MSSTTLMFGLLVAGSALAVGVGLGWWLRGGAERNMRGAGRREEARASVPKRSSVEAGRDTRATAPLLPEPRLSEPAALLAGSQSWGYQLQDIDVKRAAASPFDILVLDHAKDGSDDTLLEAGEVARLKCKPDGGRRLVLAYLSIGEAESYRGYWRKSWERRPPEWLLGENPDWEGNYSVCFWHPDWRAILCGSPTSLLDRIVEQGFDGIYLDKCDVTEDLRRHEKPVARARKDLEGDMIQLVGDLASYARERRPGFLVLMQNAEPLLERPALRGIIDGVAKEELLFGLEGDEEANAADEIAWSCERLDLVRHEGKPVLMVEYLDDAKKRMTAEAKARDLGYLLYVADANRVLDRLVLPVASV